MHLLEKQVENQQTEITGLRDVVEDLRSSLQLSDAQNLALQVLLKKMAKAEVQLPVIGNSYVLIYCFLKSGKSTIWGGRMYLFING